MSEAITIARPYAQAAFDFAKQKGALKSWSDLLQAASAAVENEQVGALIASPRVRPQQLQQLMLALCGDTVDQPGRNFIHLLIDERRLSVLPEIASQFETLRAEEEKSVDVEVNSAIALDEAQKQKISAALRTRLGREIRLHCEVDAGLLGGVVIRAGDKVIDGTVLTRLAEMSSALA
jgi:F-type H+-transporting ATPase subunit delta